MTVVDDDEMVARYLKAVSTADAELAVSLFAEDAVVYSPLYGPMAPRDFYPALFADTSAAHLTLRPSCEGTTRTDP